MSLVVFFKSRNSLLTAFCKGSAEREKLKNNIESIKKLVENGMKSVQKSDLHSFSIPILVDVNIGENWGLLQ